MPYIPPEYPTDIPSVIDLPDRQDNLDIIYAARYNEIKKELLACLNELGTLPKGSFTDLRNLLETRLNQNLKTTDKPTFIKLNLLGTNLTDETVLHAIGTTLDTGNCLILKNDSNSMTTGRILKVLSGSGGLNEVLYIDKSGSLYTLQKLITKGPLTIENEFSTVTDDPLYYSELQITPLNFFGDHTGAGILHAMLNPTISHFVVTSTQIGSTIYSYFFLSSPQVFSGSSLFIKEATLYWHSAVAHVNNYITQFVIIREYNNINGSIALFSDPTDRGVNISGYQSYTYFPNVSIVPGNHTIFGVYFNQQNSRDISLLGIRIKFYWKP